MMKKIVGLFFITLIVSGCSKVREQTFMNNFCSSARSDADLAICKCMFKVMDGKLADSIGETWIYNPNSFKRPEFNAAFQEAGKCSSGWAGGR